MGHLLLVLILLLLRFPHAFVQVLTIFMRFLLHPDPHVGLGALLERIRIEVSAGSPHPGQAFLCELSNRTRERGTPPRSRRH